MVGVFVVANVVSGIWVGAALPLLILHTLFGSMIGLSVVWLRYKGLDLAKR